MSEPPTKMARLGGEKRPDVLVLNVGGTLFHTLYDTLERASSPFFENMLDGRFPVRRDASGHIFIDRNPAYFAPILAFLRDRNTPASVLPLHDPAFLREIDFYGLEKDVLGPLVLLAIGGHVKSQVFEANIPASLAKTVAMYYPKLDAWVEKPVSFTVSMASSIVANNEALVLGGWARETDCIKRYQLFGGLRAFAVRRDGSVHSAKIPKETIEFKEVNNTLSLKTDHGYIPIVTDSGFVPAIGTGIMGDFSRDGHSCVITTSVGYVLLENGKCTLLSRSRFHFTHVRQRPYGNWANTSNFHMTIADFLRVSPGKLQYWSVCVEYNDLLYFITCGGENVSMHSYDLQTGIIDHLPDPLWSVSKGTAAVAADGCIYCTGGSYGEEVVSSAVQVYDIAAREWSSRTPMPRGRWGHTLVALSVE